MPYNEENKAYIVDSLNKLHTIFRKVVEDEDMVRIQDLQSQLIIVHRIYFDSVFEESLQWTTN